MRVVLVPSSYAPVIGGVQTVARVLAQRLMAQDVEVRVFTNRYPRTLPSREALDGIPVNRCLFLKPKLRDLKSQRLDLFVASFYCAPAALLRLYLLMREFRPEVVNVHFPDTQIPFILWLRRQFEFRLVVSLHGHDIERWVGIEKSPSSEKHSILTRESKRPFRDFLQILQRADAVTACSQYLLDIATQLESSVAQKGYVIHNGVDLTRFENGERFSHPRPYVFAFGRITYQKGFDLLLRAFAELVPSFPEVDLIIAGDGEDQEALEKEVKSRSLDRRVIFFGQANPEQVVALLNGCLFAAVPSRWEPFGIVALEAMAASKVIVATQVGGIPEFVEASGNRLVKPTTAGLAEGLREVLLRIHELESAGELNRERARQYNWDETVRKYLEAYGAA